MIARPLSALEIFLRSLKMALSTGLFCYLIFCVPVLYETYNNSDLPIDRNNYGSSLSFFVLLIFGGLFLAASLALVVIFSATNWAIFRFMSFHGWSLFAALFSLNFLAGIVFFVCLFSYVEDFSPLDFVPPSPMAIEFAAMFALGVAPSVWIAFSNLRGKKSA